MQYLLTYNELGSEFSKRDSEADGPAYWGAWTAYMASIAQAGIMVSAGGLHPPHTASTLRVTEGKRVVHDGPFADTKEQLGGFCVIDVDSLDKALEWAELAPCATAGSVEVRPLLPPPA